MNPKKAPSNGRFARPREGRAGQESVRTAAVWIIERTLASRSPMDGFLAGVAEGFDERDQGLLRELVLGTLRWLKLLDHVLVAASGRKLEQIQDDLLGVLRVAVYQLLFLDRVPAHAIVSEAVDQAHRRSHRAAASFVNAVLRRIAREPTLEAWPVRIDDLAGRLAVETSHPEILVRRWLDRFGEEATRSLLDADNRQKPMHLLAFRGKGGRELLAEQLIDEGIEVEPSRVSALGLVVREGQALRTRAFHRGDFYVQDEAAQAAALVPKPSAGERVLDAAASPGGKGLALLAAEPGVELVAADVSLPRLAMLAANHRRINAGGGRRTNIAGASSELTPFRDAFDRVIVDYPCSGTGTLRKHPELKWRFGTAELARLAEQALGMMSGAALAVKKGGILVGISCSLEEEENEAMGRRLLERRPELERFPIADAISSREIPGVVSEESLRIPTAGDHDGFTVQLFVRTK